MTNIFKSVDQIMCSKNELQVYATIRMCRKAVNVVL